MAILDDLAALLQTGGVGTIGTDLFAGDMPPAPDDLVVLYETPGDPPIDAMGADAKPPVERVGVQVVARAKDGALSAYQTARAKARAAYAVLVNVGNETVGSAYYLRAAPLQRRLFVSRDENERVLFAVNFTAWREAE